MPKEKILPVNEVRLIIPRKRLINLFYAKRYLTPKERAKMRRFLRQIEKNFTMLRHVESIVGRILLKTLDSRE